MPAQLARHPHLATASTCALRQGRCRLHGGRRSWGRRCGQLSCQLIQLLLLLNLHGSFRGSDSGNRCRGAGLAHAAVCIEPSGRKGRRCRHASRQHSAGQANRHCPVAYGWRAASKMSSRPQAILAAQRSTAQHSAAVQRSASLGLSLVDGPILLLVPGPPAVQPLARHPSASINEVAAASQHGRPEGTGSQAGRQASTAAPSCSAGTSMGASRRHAPNSHLAHLASMLSVATTAMVCCCTGGAAQALLRGQKPREAAASGTSRAACRAEMCGDTHNEWSKNWQWMRFASTAHTFVETGGVQTAGRAAGAGLTPADTRASHGSLG